MKYQAPRGTNDILPIVRAKDKAFEVHRWQWVEILWWETVSQYGYEEIRTPIFEDIDLFLRSSGETSDIVQKEMYDFYDKGERHIALRPEGTAPVMRAYLEHGIGNLGHPSRLAYEVECFRYGRPGQGRYRQLHQFGMELIGSESPQADAEIIAVTHEFYNRSGLDDLKVSLNSIGRPADRAAYGDAILSHIAAWLSDQDLEEREKANKNPLRLLDTKNPKLMEALDGVPQIQTYLDERAKSHFDGVCSSLEESGIEFEIDQSIVRGLDYYTDTVFEFNTQALDEKLALCGGGRYDELIQQMGGQPTPSVGVGIGIERLLLGLTSLDLIPNPDAPDAFLIAATEDARKPIRDLARLLRSEGYTVQYDIDDKKMKQQFKQADRFGARFAVILGEDEMRDNTYTIKELATGNQTSILQDQLIETLTQ